MMSWYRNCFRVLFLFYNDTVYCHSVAIFDHHITMLHLLIQNWLIIIIDSLV